MAKRLRVGIAGATGVAGQQFIAALAGHPWFEVAALWGSARSAGKSYREALRSAAGALLWHEQSEVPVSVADMQISALPEAGFTSLDMDLVLSALDAEVARQVEPLFAKAVPVVSLARAFRDEPDVPLVIPGVNPEQLQWIPKQQAARGWKGFLVATPNCTATGLCITLRPVLEAFGIERLIMTSMQACSGAGRATGVLGLDILDNLIPFIRGEEERVQIETQKILGARFSISCTCTRVPVLDGHTEVVNLVTQRAFSLDDISALWSGFRPSAWTSLPSAPAQWIRVHDDPFRPQPRLDRDQDHGMTTHVGRISLDNAIGPHGARYVLLSHNTKMGAARGAVLLAEYMLAQNLLL